MIATMMATVRNIRVVEDALSQWSRSKTSAVTDAYMSIMELQKLETGMDPSPENHLLWLDTLSYHGGVHIMPRSRIDHCIMTMSNGGDPLEGTGLGIDKHLFDHKKHIIVTTQLTPLSYLLDNPHPGTVPPLGPNAMGMSSVKYCAVWWNV